MQVRPHMFSSHNHYSSPPSYTGLASLYPLGVEPLYTWAYDSAQLCENTPACLACPALLQCDWMLLEVSTTPPPFFNIFLPQDSCECNGVTAGNKGECKTSNSGGPFCYVDRCKAVQSALHQDCTQLIMQGLILFLWFT